MADNPLQSLIDAPLADACKINLPMGRRPAPRGSRETQDHGFGQKISAKDMSERKKKAAQEKLSKLFDYYATTNLTAERVAEHMGLKRSEQTGTDDKGKPIFSQVLDVRRAEQELAWRRKSA